MNGIFFASFLHKCMFGRRVSFRYFHENDFKAREGRGSLPSRYQWVNGIEISHHWQLIIFELTSGRIFLGVLNFQNISTSDDKGTFIRLFGDLKIMVICCIHSRSLRYPTFLYQHILTYKGNGDRLRTPTSTTATEARTSFACTNSRTL